MLTRTEHKNMQPRTALLSVRSSLELMSCLKALSELVLSSIICSIVAQFFFNDATELKANFSLRVNESQKLRKEKKQKEMKKRKAEIWKCHIDYIRCEIRCESTVKEV